MSLILNHLFIVSTILVAAAGIVVVLQQRRTPQSAAAWVLFMVTVPYVALPVFLALGFRKEDARFSEVSFETSSADRFTGNNVEALLSSLGAPPALSGNAIDLHEHPQDAARALIDLIDSAEETLDLLFYIVARDDAGRDFVRRLTARAKQGVKVRLVLDRLGSLSRPRAELDALKAAGGQVRYFSPFIHLSRKGHMNLRNHRKLVIADGQRVWSGGRNIGDDYLGTGEDTWNDLSFRADGPIVQHFCSIFDSDWEVTEDAPPPRKRNEIDQRGNAALQLLPSGPDEPNDILHDGLVNIIHGAQRRIWIVTPYFVPTEPLQQALKTAARRGVDLRIAMPKKSNQFTADLARGAYLRDLEAVGATVMQYQPGMLHAKAGLVDDVAWVGSANFDVRSLLLNFELVLFIYDTDTVHRLERYVEGILEASRPGMGTANLPRRVLEGVFRLGAPIL